MPKNFSTNQLRPFRDRDVIWYTPLLPFVAGGFILLMMILARYVESKLTLPEGFINFPLARKGVGSVITVVGIIFFTLGMGKSLLFNSKQRARKFITTGVFKYSRNPSAFGTISTLLGVALILNSLGMILISFLMLVLLTLTVHFTDRLMYEAYGEKFLKYQDSTPRFIPDFNRLICNIFGLD